MGKVYQIGGVRFTQKQEPGPRQIGLLPYAPMSGVDPDADEYERRRGLLAKAKEGNEEALADLRNGYRVTTLVIDGRPLIKEGVLVGVKR
jgi:hypothetical protein